jgi:hypothetical protein
MRKILETFLSHLVKSRRPVPQSGRLLASASGWCRTIASRIRWTLGAFLESPLDQRRSCTQSSSQQWQERPMALTLYTLFASSLSPASLLVAVGRRGSVEACIPTETVGTGGWRERSVLSNASAIGQGRHCYEADSVHDVRWSDGNPRHSPSVQLIRDTMILCQPEAPARSLTLCGIDCLGLTK